MKAKDIKAGMTCTVGWFFTGHMASRTDYLAHGTIIFRRGGRVKFKWESGDTMDADFIATPSYSSEFFWVSVIDLKSIDGVPIAEWGKLEPRQTQAVVPKASA